MRKIGMLAITALFLMTTSVVLAGGMAEEKPAGGTALPMKVEVGGFADAVYYKIEGVPGSFALGHFNPILAASVSDKLSVEAQLEWGNGEDLVGDGDADLVYGYLDYIFKDSLVLRAGQFLVPFGVFNTTIYPATVNKLPTTPLPMLDVVPVKWAEVGAQLHGVIETGSAVALNYAVYIVNGLQAPVGVVTDGLDGLVLVEELGGSLRDTRNNFVDWTDSDKALGGRLGASIGSFEAGLSGYNGAYSADGDQDISIFGVDLAYTYENFELRGEFAKASQDVASDVDKDGFYIQAAYKFLEKYEAVARYDEADLGVPGAANNDRITVGGNYFITDNLTLRAAYQFADIGGADADGVIGSLAVGF